MSSAIRFEKLVVAQPLVGNRALVKEAFDFIVCERRAEETAAHGVVDAVDVSRFAFESMPCRERRSERAAGISGRRLNPDTVERTFAQNAPVTDAVERDAACHA